MRMLRKKGTLGPSWPWHPILAKRSDMEDAPAGKPDKPDKPAKAEPDESTNDLPDDKAELKRQIKELGGTVRGNPSVKKLQEKLAELKADEGE